MLLDLACLSLTAVLLFQWVGRRHGNAAACVGVLMLLSHSVYLSMAASGMESAAYSGLILSSFLLYSLGRYGAAFFVGGLCMFMRLDGVAVLVALSVTFAFQHRRVPIRALIAPVVLNAAWFAFALIYFGDALPHALIAKRYHTGHQVLTPDILYRIAENSPFALFLAGTGALALVRARAAWAMGLLAWLAIYVLGFLFGSVEIYLWYVAAPHLVVTLFAAVGFGWWLDLAKDRASRRAAIALGFAVVALHAVHQQVGVFGKRLCHPDEVRYQAARAAAPLLTPESRVAAGAVGAIGWFSGARIIDVMGLVSNECLGYHPEPYARNAMVQAIVEQKPGFVFSDSYVFGPIPELVASYRLVQEHPYSCGDGVRAGTIELWQRVAD